ncbi:NADH-dependent phenylglyoxylate dehydrogenase subunit beta [Magnetospirillum sp. SS-4]|uniref:NADH-dependent phenylglyoxylate dehydrogenase subunit beta n=1 Tax=Magnetospirillum sp. SS-4 TaxID=2681465 RepID=UPI0013851C57|nr:thiamine pyrophosphate-dependent enzyme [Magnetospirillum sp. SS-4]CAA7626259.1 NADH-dependent phenylglyoxylate dehydrogenase subunit beta [Magnetospirillum sp. SS-4]
MGAAFDTIAFKGSLCDGCGDCMTACSSAKKGASRLSIVPGASEKVFELAICRQCGDPKCAMVCPSGALAKDGGSGVIGWDADKCIDCLLCTAGCAYGGIAVDPGISRVAKCDMCDGDPACVKSCPTGALEYRKAGSIYNEYGGKEDLFVPGLSGCLGCNSELIMRHTMRKIGRNSVLATPPGCIPGMGSVGYNGKTGTKVPVFHPLLTNTASMLAGIRRHYDRIGRKDIVVMALAGDGGTADCGFHAVSGAAERGDKILYICVDNEGYMNTGMQRSGTTPYGSWTSTTPVGEHMKGKTQDAKNLPMIMAAHKCRYVATASTGYMEDLYEKLDRAVEASFEGFAYLHIYSPCPTGWRVPSSKVIEACRMSVESNFVTLWEYTPKTGIRFTRSPDNALPVSAYVKMIGKYRHLSQDQLDHIQAKVDEQVALLKVMAADSPPPPAAHRPPAGSSTPAGGETSQTSLRREISRN